jgi:hypothetical protein
LVGKPVNQSTLQAAQKILKDEVLINQDDRIEYRQRLVSSFFFKYFVSLIASTPATGGESKVPLSMRSVTDVPKRLVSRGQQAYRVTEEHKPVSDPVMKIGAPVRIYPSLIYHATNTTEPNDVD